MRRAVVEGRAVRRGDVSLSADAVAHLAYDDLSPLHSEGSLPYSWQVLTGAPQHHQRIACNFHDSGGWSNLLELVIKTTQMPIRGLKCVTFRLRPEIGPLEYVLALEVMQRSGSNIKQILSDLHDIKWSVLLAWPYTIFNASRLLGRPRNHPTWHKPAAKNVPLTKAPVVDLGVCTRATYSITRALTTDENPWPPLRLLLCNLLTGGCFQRYSGKCNMMQALQQQLQSRAPGSAQSLSSSQPPRYLAWVTNCPGAACAFSPVEVAEYAVLSSMAA